MLKRALFWLLFLPLQIGLLALFAVCDLLRIPRLAIDRRRSVGADGRAPLQADAEPVADLCSIVMLNWNGRHLLEESIPALLKAVHFTGKAHEIMVVDNGSTDDSIEWLSRNYPQIRLLALEENLGFGEGNNRGVEAARHHIVVLLNNDMIVAEDFLPPLLEAFRDPDVFAASSQIHFPEGRRREETGNTQGQFRWGYLHLSHEPIQRYHYTRRYLPVLWAGGGSSAFDRRRFLELGGFSSLFSPCYVEDTDLGYRAWRRGWKLLLAGQSRVLHKHRSSASVRFDKSTLERLMEERKLWYVWKNYGLWALAGHLLLLPLHFGDKVTPGTYLRSLRKLSSLMLLRWSEPSRFCSDSTLFGWVRRPLLYLNRFPPDRSRLGGSSLRLLIVSAYLPHLGQHGGAGRVFQLLRQVAKRHQISVISFVENEQESGFASQLRPHCQRVETVFRRNYVPVSPFPYEPFEEFNCADFRQRLEELLLEANFDLVHFEWTQMAQYADLFPHIPKLLTEIEVNYAAYYSLVEVEGNPLRKFRRWYNTLQTLYREVELCGKVDQVVCVTDKDRGYLEGYVEAPKLSVINTGVDIDYFGCRAGGTPDPDTLVFVGAFRHEPNVDAMRYFCREIFPLILRQRPHTRLLIVGSSPPPSVRSLDSHPQITVTGYVEDIRDYYEKAQVVVVPLRIGVGIRGKILEAWAAGKAVVATSVACMGIRAGHGQNVLITDSPGEFALWTLALLRNPDYCRRLGEAGRRTAEQYYDWRIVGEQMIALYESIVRQKESQPTTSGYTR